MTISPFFLDLHSAYQSELDDLTFDSDGRDVLRQRLAAKRKELGFLLQMMELSPEMVAVIFHQGFVFREPALMEHLLSLEADELPEWDSLAGGIQMTPWARELVQSVLQAPAGPWFMAVAAGLHYLAGKPAGTLSRQGGADASRDDDAGEDGQEQEEEEDFDDYEDASGDSQARREAGADWLADQGFDRKD